LIKQTIKYKTTKYKTTKYKTTKYKTTNTKSTLVGIFVIIIIRLPKKKRFDPHFSVFYLFFIFYSLVKYYINK